MTIQRPSSRRKTKRKAQEPPNVNNPVRHLFAKCQRQFVLLRRDTPGSPPLDQLVCLTQALAHRGSTCPGRRMGMSGEKLKQRWIGAFQQIPHPPPPRPKKGAAGGRKRKVRQASRRSQSLPRPVVPRRGCRARMCRWPDFTKYMHCAGSPCAKNALPRSETARDCSNCSSDFRSVSSSREHSQEEEEGGIMVNKASSPASPLDAVLSGTDRGDDRSDATLLGREILFFDGGAQLLVEQ